MPTVEAVSVQGLQVSSEDQMKPTTKRNAIIASGVATGVAVLTALSGMDWVTQNPTTTWGVTAALGILTAVLPFVKAKAGK